tara:strand:- start:304 stop:408 length:105 start_codon:yes stop_codon:yes gene_type:complete
MNLKKKKNSGLFFKKGQKFAENSSAAGSLLEDAV